MSRRAAIILVVGAVLTIAAAGVGLAASSRQPECARTEYAYPDAGHGGDGVSATGGRVVLVCVERTSDPFDENAAQWWWFATGAILALTAVGLTVTRERGHR